MPHKIIDTHIHIWQLDQSPYNWLKEDTSLLNRSYAISELEKDRVAAGITGGILVQADNTTEDTAWMLKVASENSWISGVVGWLPLTDPAATARLLEEKYGSHPLFKGVRHLIHNEADPEWLLQDSVIESLQLLAQYGLPYDLVGIVPEHIETALKVSEKVPSLRMIFDHMNQPPVAPGKSAGKWGGLMKDAALHGNFYVKISGLGTTAGTEAWSANDIQPYIEFIIEHFGEDRCCCGGDWPVSLLAGSYTYTWSQYKKIFSNLLTGDAQDKIYFKNAERFYNI